MKIALWIVGAVVAVFVLLFFIGLFSKDEEMKSVVPETAPLDTAAALPEGAPAVDTAIGAGAGVAVAGAAVESIVEDSDVLETAVDAVGTIFDLFT